MLTKEEIKLLATPEGVEAVARRRIEASVRDRLDDGLVRLLRRGDGLFAEFLAAEAANGKLRVPAGKGWY